MIRLVAYVWLGMVLGVSFLATPIKFQARSITMPVALDVGRATFHAFAKVEFALAALMVIAAVRLHVSGTMRSVDWALLALALIIVLGQTQLMIPRLDDRVEAIISGRDIAPSHLHTMYAASEGAKALTLVLIGGWTGGR